LRPVIPHLRCDQPNSLADDCGELPPTRSAMLRIDFVILFGNLSFQLFRSARSNDRFPSLKKRGQGRFVKLRSEQNPPHSLFLERGM
jgi:hypothetical protein